MKLLESGQMYLETIYVLLGQSPTVRAIDVGEHLGYSKPSVSRAIGILKKDGYVTVDKDGFLALTDEGRAMAEKVFRRHTALTALFTRLGVSPDTAASDACRIEHVISDETFDAIEKHLEKEISSSPSA